MTPVPSRADEIEFEAIPGEPGAFVVKDGVVFIWIGDGTICGCPDGEEESHRRLLGRCPWEFRYIGYSHRLGMHLFRRGKDKLLKLFPLGSEFY